MKLRAYITALSLFGTAGIYALPAHAQVPSETSAPAVAPAETDMAGALLSIARRWDQIEYQMHDKDAQVKAFQALEGECDAIARQYPDQAEPKIWGGIIYSTQAGISGGMGALSTVNKAKELFEAAIAENSSAMNGGAHTSLGSLYYKVPGWPVAFGNDKKAESELKTALSISPDDIDANYFYGDFLIHQKKYGSALAALQKAMASPQRPGRDVGDAGRRADIQADITIAQKQLDSEK